MANKNLTVYQRLTKMFGSDGVKQPQTNVIQTNKYSLNANELLKTTDKAEFERKKLEIQQTKYLQNTWSSAGRSLAQNQLQSESVRIGAYVDFENMEYYPLISAALDIMSEEATVLNNNGRMMNIYSDNKRVKQILEDLFFNRLDLHTSLPMWTRNVCKYGDNFCLLNIDDKRGILGARQLPNIEMLRKEVDFLTSNSKEKDKTTFIWNGRNAEFNEWQIAHFRLLSEDRKLPYGTSIMEKARMIWKRLIMSEDAMLVYRITRAPERRVYKVYVGNIDDADVQAYVDKIANQFKRTGLIDPQTGQIDLKYNQLGNDQDFFIPTRDESLPMPIETLPGACLALDTKIELLDGRSLELSEIIKEHSEGKDLWSYSINPINGAIAPAKITWAGITRKNTEALKITLDNGEIIVCTSDHKFPTKDNGKKEAKDLLIGESLYSFNKQFKPIRDSKSEYEMIYDHSKNKFLYTHRIVANFMKELDKHNKWTYNEKYINEEKNTIHHKDINRFNNIPTNLVYMNLDDHYLYHYETFSRFASMGGKALAKKLKENENFRNEFSKLRAEISTKMWENRTKEERNIITEKQSISLINYVASLSEKEREQRAEISRKNVKLANEAFNEKMKNENFKKELYDKSSKSLKITKNTPEYKLKQSNISKELFKSEEYKEKVFKNQKTNYSNRLLTIITELINEDSSLINIINIINDPEHEFNILFKELNKNNKQFNEKSKGITRSNIDKMLKYFGYKNWRDFNSKIPFYNHKIVSIEYLETKIDTGTITIDGKHEYHDYHTFALSSGVFTYNSNLNDIADIAYLRDNLFTAIRVPKTFLGFEDAKGEGKNLSLQDIRFARTINRIQQTMLQELNKIAMIHLYTLGFEDDFDNFTLTLTNPSTQAEMLKVEHMQIKTTLYKDAVSDAGNGFGAMSMTRAKREILGWSDDDIKQDLLEQRMEKAAAAELANTEKVIKHTGMFDKVDTIYGDIEKAREGVSGDGEGGSEDAGGGSSGGGGGFGGGGLGSEDLDFGEDTEETGNEEEGGATADAGAEQGTEAEATENKPDETLAENVKKKKELLTNETKKKVQKYTKSYNQKYMDYLDGKTKSITESIKFEDENFKINENVNNFINEIDKKLKE